MSTTLQAVICAIVTRLTGCCLHPAEYPGVSHCSSKERGKPTLNRRKPIPSPCRVIVIEYIEITSPLWSMGEYFKVPSGGFSTAEHRFNHKLSPPCRRERSGAAITNKRREITESVVLVVRIRISDFPTSAVLGKDIAGEHPFKGRAA
jgi:hypothetical protein